MPKNVKSAFLTKIKSLLKENGYLFSTHEQVRLLNSNGRSMALKGEGFPDVELYLKDKVIFFIVKNDTTMVSEIQRTNFKRLTDLDYDIYLLRPSDFDDFKAIIKSKINNFDNLRKWK